MAKIRTLFVFCVLSLSCAAGSGRILFDVSESGSVAPLAPLTIFGYVQREEFPQEPVVGAQIYVSEPTTLGSYADSTGRYEFTVPEPGEYEVIAIRVGYRDDTFAVSVDSMPVRVDFSLRELDIRLWGR